MSKDDHIRAAIAQLHESLDEPDQEATTMTIHLIAKNNQDLRLRPTKWETPANPCPFCGHENITIRRHDYGRSFSVHFCHCMRCHSEGPAKGHRRGAILAWNTRLK